MLVPRNVILLGFLTGFEAMICHVIGRVSLEKIATHQGHLSLLRLPSSLFWNKFSGRILG